VRLLLLAPPGAGKGTQGKLLAARLCVRHIAAGDLLRAEARAGTPDGDIHFAFGDAARGTTGFRITHQQAIAAQAVVLASGLPRRGR